MALHPRHLRHPRYAWGCGGFKDGDMNDTPSSLNNVVVSEPESKSVLKSKSFYGALILLLTFIAQMKGWQFDPNDPQTQATIDMTLKGIGWAMMIWGRWTAKQPLHVIPPAETPESRILFQCVALILFSATLIFSLCGCASVAAWQANPRTQRVERVAGQIALDALLSTTNQLRSGQKLDNAWAVNIGINSLVDVVKSLTNQQAAALVTETTTEFAPADKDFAQAGTKLGNVLLEADPKTPEARANVVAALAQGVGTAAAAADLTR